MKKFHSDLLQIQRNATKVYAAKSNLLGMAFIAVAAIVPALFAAIALLGQILGFTFTSLQVLFTFAVLFPVVDYAFLYYLEMTSPQIW